MNASLPNPFVTPAADSPSAPAGQATARVGDAPVAVAAPSVNQRFKPDMNRLYLDMISMSQPEPRRWSDTTPLFLRKPMPPIEPVIERKAARNFVEALIDLGRRD